MSKCRAELIRACDRLWSRLVAHGMNYRCIICGMPGDDSHHWFYIRSVHQYRWTLENGVYMCRIHHGEAVSNYAPLHLKIKTDYPHLWAWGESRSPLVSQPISTLRIEWILEKLQSTAKTLGVKQ